MATAHLMHGYMGAGKTTFARRLEVEHRAVRFTHDEWMAELYGDDPPDAHFADCFRRVSSLMETMWTRCLSTGVDIVLDAGLWTRAERDRTRALVREIGAEHRLYRLHCKEEIAWSRIERRNREPHGGLTITRDTFDLRKHRFEPLQPDEERLEIASGRPITRA